LQLISAWYNSKASPAVLAMLLGMFLARSVLPGGSATTAEVVRHGAVYGLSTVLTLFCIKGIGFEQEIPPRIFPVLMISYLTAKFAAWTVTRRPPADQAGSDFDGPQHAGHSEN
jgi:hypothetical protein